MIEGNPLEPQPVVRYQLLIPMGGVALMTRLRLMQRSPIAWWI